jgi:hypothetical protein
MPVLRCGFSRARDIVTESSNGSFASFAILFMATCLRFREAYIDHRLEEKIRLSE